MLWFRIYLGSSEIAPHRKHLMLDNPALGEKIAAVGLAAAVGAVAAVVAVAAMP